MGRIEFELINDEGRTRHVPHAGGDPDVQLGELGFDVEQLTWVAIVEGAS
jgi:hypothetical protein